MNTGLKTALKGAEEHSKATNVNIYVFILDKQWRHSDLEPHGMPRIVVYPNGMHSLKSENDPSELELQRRKKT